MFALANDLDKKLANSHISPDFIFGISDVRRAVNKLKAHKHEGGSALSSDHIINVGMTVLSIQGVCLPPLPYMDLLLIIFFTTL